MKVVLASALVSFLAFGLIAMAVWHPAIRRFSRPRCAATWNGYLFFERHETELLRSGYPWWRSARESTQRFALCFWTDLGMGQSRHLG